VQIVHFIGNLIDAETYHQLYATEGQKRIAYAHPLSERGDFYLDCYENQGSCKASYANSALNCRSVGSVYPSTANCYVSINEQRGTMMLKCLVDHIPANTELIWDYEASYIYPSHYDE